MIAIVDYGMGNLRSVLQKFKRLNVEATITSNVRDIARAKQIILPGVGHFATGMKNLKAYGLIDILNKKVLEEKTPILGICLGVQLFTKYSEEGNVNGLGWIDAKTIKFDLNGSRLKVPHIGWNSITIKKNSHVFENVNQNELFYFVHSYHLVCNNVYDILAVTNYGIEFTSAVEKDNIYGTQFHPEKSHDFGTLILKNFVEKV